MAYSTHANPDVARRLSILRRQIYEAHNSLIIHLTLHSVVGASPKSTCADAFWAISNASLNNLIVMTHQLFDQSAKTIVEGLGLDIGEVEAILKAAAACVEELFLANPILGMPIPGFDQSYENLEAQLKNMFAKGFV